MFRLQSASNEDHVMTCVLRDQLLAVSDALVGPNVSLVHAIVANTTCAGHTRLVSSSIDVIVRCRRLTVQIRLANDTRRIIDEWRWEKSGITGRLVIHSGHLTFCLPAKFQWIESKEKRNVRIVFLLLLLLATTGNHSHWMQVLMPCDFYRSIKVPHWRTGRSTQYFSWQCLESDIREALCKRSAFRLCASPAAFLKMTFS